jgi:hypothetical protein
MFGSLHIDLTGKQAGEKQVAGAAKVLDLARMEQDTLEHWFGKPVKAD